MQYTKHSVKSQTTSAFTIWQESLVLADSHIAKIISFRSTGNKGSPDSTV